MINNRDSKVTELEKLLESEKNEHSLKLSNMEAELAQCKSENKDLTSQITKITQAHDELEAYGHRESLVFSGDKIKPHEPNEDCILIAKSIIQNTLKLNMDPLISTAHRMGKPPARDSSSPDKRAIIVKFIKRDDKYQILKTARDKSTRVLGLFANESLTPTRSKILNVLRKCKGLSNGLVKGTSTLNGRVFAIHLPSPTAPQDSNVMRTEINTKEKLEEFCRNFLSKPLETFLDAEGRNSSIRVPCEFSFIILLTDRNHVAIFNE